MPYEESIASVLERCIGRVHSRPVHDLSMSISALAKRCGNNRRTVRYWEQLGLFESDRIGTASARYYPRRSIYRALLVSELRDAGLSAAQIKGLFQSHPELVASVESGPVESDGRGAWGWMLRYGHRRARRILAARLLGSVASQLLNLKDLVPHLFVVVHSVQWAEGEQLAVFESSASEVDTAIQTEECLVCFGDETGELVCDVEISPFELSNRRFFKFVIGPTESEGISGYLVYVAAPSGTIADTPGLPSNETRTICIDLITVATSNLTQSFREASDRLRNVDPSATPDFESLSRDHAAVTPWLAARAVQLLDPNWAFVAILNAIPTAEMYPRGLRVVANTSSDPWNPILASESRLRSGQLLSGYSFKIQLPLVVSKVDSSTRKYITNLDQENVMGACAIPILDPESMTSIGALYIGASASRNHESIDENGHFPDVRVKSLMIIASVFADLMKRAELGARSQHEASLLALPPQATVTHRKSTELRETLERVLQELTDPKRSRPPTTMKDSDDHWMLIMARGSQCVGGRSDDEDWLNDQLRRSLAGAFLQIHSGRKPVLTPADFAVISLTDRIRGSASGVVLVTRKWLSGNQIRSVRSMLRERFQTDEGALTVGGQAVVRISAWAVHYPKEVLMASVAANGKSGPKVDDPRDAVVDRLVSDVNAFLGAIPRLDEAFELASRGALEQSTRILESVAISYPNSDRLNTHVHRELGHVLLRQGRLGDALDHARSALQGVYCNERTRCLVGDIHLAMGNPKVAATEFAQAAADGGGALAYWRLSDVLVETAKFAIALAADWNTVATAVQPYGLACQSFSSEASEILRLARDILCDKPPDADLVARQETPREGSAVAASHPSIGGGSSSSDGDVGGKHPPGSTLEKVEPNPGLLVAELWQRADELLIKALDLNELGRNSSRFVLFTLRRAEINERRGKFDQALRLSEAASSGGVGQTGDLDECALADVVRVHARKRFREALAEARTGARVAAKDVAEATNKEQDAA